VLCVYPEREVDPRLAPETMLDLLSLMKENVTRLERIAAARGRPSADEQVWALLDALADGRSTGRRKKALQLRQKDIALLLQVRPETVCRALRRLTDTGLIRQDASGVLPLPGAPEVIEGAEERRARRRAR
jgi:CRP-like cAMP-binding protein